MELDEWEEPPEEGNASLDQLIIGATKTPMVSRRSAESLPMSNLRCQKMNSRASRTSLSNSSELLYAQILNACPWDGSVPVKLESS